MYLYHLERRGGKGRDWGPGVGRGKGRGEVCVARFFSLRRCMYIRFTGTVLTSLDVYFVGLSRSRL